MSLACCLAWALGSDSPAAPDCKKSSAQGDASCCWVMVRPQRRKFPLHPGALGSVLLSPLMLGTATCRTCTLEELKRKPLLGWRAASPPQKDSQALRCQEHPTHLSAPDMDGVCSLPGYLGALAKVLGRLVGWAGLDCVVGTSAAHLLHEHHLFIVGAPLASSIR